MWGKRKNLSGGSFWRAALKEQPSSAALKEQPSSAAFKEQPSSAAVPSSHLQQLYLMSSCCCWGWWSSFWYHLAAVRSGGQPFHITRISSSMSLWTLFWRTLSPRFRENSVTCQGTKLQPCHETLTWWIGAHIRKSICLQSKSANASKILELVSSTLQKLWREPKATVSTVHLIILYFTLIRSMPSAWQDRKAIASRAKRQQLHHNEPTPWFTQCDPQWHCCSQRKLHLPLPPLNRSEASENFFSSGWKGASRCTGCHHCHYHSYHSSKVMRTLDTSQRQSGRHGVFFQSTVHPETCRDWFSTIATNVVWTYLSYFQLSNAASSFSKKTDWKANKYEFNWTTLQKQAKDTNDTNQRIWGLKVLKFVSHWRKRGSHKQTKLYRIGSLQGNGLGNEETLAFHKKFSPNPNAESECLQCLSMYNTSQTTPRGPVCNLSA